jgi:hypothetical protein
MEDSVMAMKPTKVTKGVATKRSFSEHFVDNGFVSVRGDTVSIGYKNPRGQKSYMSASLEAVKELINQQS